MMADKESSKETFVLIYDKWRYNISYMNDFPYLCTKMNYE